MAIEILGFIRRGDKAHAPTRQVRCTACGAVYARTGSASDIRRRGGCNDCANKRRTLYASLQERRRAQNQRYWQRRKLREAGAA